MIHITAALPCEARPLIDYYKLKTSTENNVYRIYAYDNVRLIITGIGKITAAAATAYLYAYYGSKQNSAWLNVGIAGHPTLNVGKSALAHKIIDHNSGLNWYPTLVINSPFPTQDLISVDRPETGFNETALYDMEASGFYATASRFATSELVQCYKVVSDNKTNHTERISKKLTTELIEKNLEPIDQIIGQLNQLASQISSIEEKPRQFDRYIKRWHFTHYQRNQLEHLLRKWKLLSPEASSLADNMKRLNNSKEVINYLKKNVEQLSRKGL